MHFQAPLSVPELAERATQMMDEACALARLASELAEFERTTGRKLFVCEGSEPKAEEFQFRSGQTETGTEIENAAQIVGDGSGEALPPIEPGVATVEETAAQPVPGQFEANASAPIVEVHEAPSSEPQAAPAPYKTKADDRPWGKLTLPERQIVKHLERLPKTFTPQDDLRLVELLTGGNKIDAAAAFLEVETDAAMTRWKSFLSEDVIGANGKPTWDGQQRLLNALRYRVETADA